MTAPPSTSALLRSSWQDFTRAHRDLILFEVLFKFTEAWLFAPVVALVLSTVLSRTGHVALTNRDVLDFLLSPLGVLYAAIFAVVALVILLFEQAGIMALISHHDPEQPFSFTAALKPRRIAELAALFVPLLTAFLGPFALLAWLTYYLLLSQQDINFYLAVRPPAFWLAGGLGALLLLAAAITCMVLYVRWAFALPIVLFEDHSRRAALKASRERVRGAGWRLGLVLVGWQLAALLVGVVGAAVFRLLADRVLAHAGERPLALILTLLLTQSALLAVLSFVTVVGQGVLTRRLYLLHSSKQTQHLATDQVSSPASRRLLYFLLPLLMLAPLLTWLNLSRYLTDRPLVKVTAHRGHSLAAPENTLSAVRKAIESGADYAEIDVQLTRDGVVVLLHDRDLKRVSGDPRRIEDVPYAETKRLDVGAWFSSAFVCERVPTLAEVIDLARGRIKLNVEMKLYGPDLRLAGAVATLLREKDFESECIVTSFNQDALRELHRHNPRLRRGVIVAHALGDVSRLDVEALSVRADWLSDDVLRSAHRAGLEVHVWTVNDAVQANHLIKRGVDNIITDDPDLLIRVRGEWAELSGAERLVLASRLLLGLDP